MRTAELGSGRQRGTLDPEAAMEDEIRAEFRKSGFDIEDEEEVLKKCHTYCINYDLKPSDLVSSWEVYYLNRQLNEPTVQNDQMEGFLLHLQNDQKEAILKEEPGLHIYSSKDVDMILNDDHDDTKEDVPGTPKDSTKKLFSESLDSAYETNGNGYSSKKPSKLVTPFGQRVEKFVVKFSINNVPDAEDKNNEQDHENLEDDIIKRVKPRERCSLVVHGSGPEPGCRFMYDRIEDKFDALESRIRKYATDMAATGLYDAPVDPTVASHKSIFAVGMIRCDGEGRLNEKSTLLQSSAEHSGGQKVRLDLQKLRQYSIFPGQIVGVQGDNPSGHCLIASKVVDSIPLFDSADTDLHPAKKQALDNGIPSTDVACLPEELSVIIAAGPYTTTDNLFFEPLTELLAYARKKLPQLLVLLGPFIDSEHPDIRKGTIDQSYEEIFRVQVLRRLQDYVECMGTAARVILMPSIRDVNHDFVYPQPAFDIQLSDLKSQITSVTNPGTFEANQVKIGCCTVDILKQLSGEEISRNPADGLPSDRMSRLANHILNQRSFYPLYPPAEDVPLDFSLASEALQFPSIPDILILPSDVKYFVKVLTLGGRSEGENEVKCICVNPGRLSRGEGGGSFVELNYHGSPDTTNASVISI